MTHLVNYPVRGVSKNVMIDLKNKDLSEIARMLLKKYHRAQSTVISEYSGNIEKDQKELDENVKAYENAIAVIQENDEASAWDALEQAELDEMYRDV
jgi:hypothetical protein